jgi:uncharacterized protein YneF (UPF0154 family)
MSMSSKTKQQIAENPPFARQAILVVMITNVDGLDTEDAK